MENGKIIPPEWPLRFLQWICPASMYEEIAGDIIEKFSRDLLWVGGNSKTNLSTVKRARRRLIWNVLRFIRPGIIFRNKFSVDLNSYTMLRSYFKFAFRHLMKSKTFSLLSIAGLAIGIASFLVILLYVDFEMSYDQFHKHKDRIFRVSYTQYENGAVKNASVKNFLGLSNWMKEELPEVEAATQFWKIRANAKFLLHYKGKLFNEAGNRIVADSTFFSVFPSLLGQGDPKSALTAKHSLVISDRIAKKIFGNEDPLGKVIAASEYNEQYEITGILKSGNVNTHLNVDFITPQDYIRDSALGRWEGPWRYTYVLLREDIAKVAFESKLNTSIQTLKHENERIKDVSLALQPVTEIHLHSNLKDEIQSNGNYLLVLILLIIGFVILIIAWINYLNLETSRFILRAKEVGVRRINGSSKADLHFQFMIEFLCVNVIAAGVAIGLLTIVLPYISHYTGLPFDRVQVRQPKLLVGFFALFTTGFLMVGTYPAFILSKINLAATLKGKFSSPVNLHTPRKIFLNFQFVSSMVLISFVLVVYKQLDFMKMSNKKIDLEKTVSVLNPTVYSSQEEKNVGEGGYANFTNFRNELLRHSQVNAVSSSSAVPGEAIGFNYVDLVKRNMGDPYDPTGYKVLFVDYNFIPLFKLKLKAGRNYSPDNGEDEDWSTLVLNESAIKALNFTSPEDAIGKEIFFMPSDDWNKYKIVGVVEDYYHEAMKKNITPTIFFLNHNRGQQVYYSIKLNAGANPQDALRIIEQTWKTIFPEKPFEYFFLDEYYDQQFKSELHFGTIFTLFAGVATFIASLGIFGMTLFEANAKMKEISIRKVLGASARSLVFLFSKKHLKIAVVASCLASPIIYVASTQWLENYPTRIEMSFLFFVTPMLLVVTMVAVISSIRVLKAAQANPVDNLKHE